MIRYRLPERTAARPLTSRMVSSTGKTSSLEILPTVCTVIFRPRAVGREHVVEAHDLGRGLDHDLHVRVVEVQHELARGRARRRTRTRECLVPALPEAGGGRRPPGARACRGGRGRRRTAAGRRGAWRWRAGRTGARGVRLGGHLDARSGRSRPGGLPPSGAPGGGAAGAQPARERRRPGASDAARLEALIGARSRGRAGATAARGRLGGAGVAEGEVPRRPDGAGRRPRAAAGPAGRRRRGRPGLRRIVQ